MFGYCFDMSGFCLVYGFIMAFQCFSYIDTIWYYHNIITILARIYYEYIWNRLLSFNIVYLLINIWSILIIFWSFLILLIFFDHSCSWIGPRPRASKSCSSLLASQWAGAPDIPSCCMHWSVFGQWGFSGVQSVIWLYSDCDRDVIKDW